MRRNLSAQILLPWNPLPQITQREHQEGHQRGHLSLQQRCSEAGLDLVRSLSEEQPASNGFTVAWKHSASRCKGWAVLCNSRAVQTILLCYNKNLRSTRHGGLPAWLLMNSSALAQPPQRHSCGYRHQHPALGQEEHPTHKKKGLHSTEGMREESKTLFLLTRIACCALQH